jgi:DNA-directed RNA polymerase subunit RPC12/RpoP
MNVRMSRWKNRWEQVMDVLGTPMMRCQDCHHRWGQSLWRFSEMIYARCPKCFRLDLTTWEETYYKIPLLWKLKANLGAKKVRCKACRHNFMSFRLVRGAKKWVNVDPLEEPVEELDISLSKIDKPAEPVAAREENAASKE